MFTLICILLVAFALGNMSKDDLTVLWFFTQLIVVIALNIVFILFFLVYTGIL